MYFFFKLILIYLKFVLKRKNIIEKERDALQKFCHMLIFYAN